MASNEDLKSVFVELHEKVVKSVNADSVIDFLFAAKVLSDADYSALNDSSNTGRVEKMRRLMAFLHSSAHPEAFVKLRQAINKEDAYEFLINDINETGKTFLRR